MHNVKPFRMPWKFTLLALLALFAGCKQEILVKQLRFGSAPIGTPCENYSNKKATAYLGRYCVTEFNKAAANLARNTVEFAVQQFERVYSGIPETDDSFSFRAVWTEFSHSIGPPDIGESIAIVDTGLYTNHPELDEKTITLYGLERPTDDRGLSVASVADGVHNSFGMMGVAYDANLNLTSLFNARTVVAVVTDHTRQNGASVQNNPWAYLNIDRDSILNHQVDMAEKRAPANEIGVESYDWPQVGTSVFASIISDDIEIFAEAFPSLN